MNSSLIIQEFDQLHHVNHLLYYHFGGMTDGKGELSVDLKAVADTQFQTEQQLKQEPV